VLQVGTVRKPWSILSIIFIIRLYAAPLPIVWAKDGEKIIENDVRPLVEDLDSLPFPDKEIFYEKLPHIRDSYISLSSRGCVNKCTFCNNSLYKDKIYRDKGRFFRRIF
jgi:radical SAM superfamily enzyme YgiQ (UPF0313 family)